MPQNDCMSTDFKKTVRIIRQDGEEPAELELVSTLMLQRMLKTDDVQAANEPELDVDPGGGFNPYDNN